MKKKKEVWIGYARSCKYDEHPFIFGITQLGKTEKAFQYYEAFSCCKIKKIRLTLEEL